MPDELLRQAAAACAPSTEQGIRDEAQRMFGHPRAQRTRESFFERWLEASAVRTAPKPPENLAFNVELREALVASARMSFSRLAWEAGQNALFESPEIWGDASMSRFYGLTPPPGPGFGVIRPTGDQKRFGLLTYPALLASMARGEETSPVARGILFVEEVLCTNVPAPPPNLDAVSPPEAHPRATMRERLGEHTDNALCNACHKLFDPIGLGLENYDGYGVWRTHENGQRINAAGRLLDIDFDGPAGLASLLGKAEEVSDCLVVQWFRYTFGREPQRPADDCTIKQLKAAFTRDGRSLQALLLATVETDAFRMRTTTTGDGP